MLKMIGSGIDKTIRDIYDGVCSRPRRTGLSFMAIALGVGTLTVLIAILQGLEYKSQKLIQNLGINVAAIIQKENSSRNSNERLLQLHATLLKKNLQDVQISTIQSKEIPTMGTQNPLTVVATDNSLIHIKGWKIKQGRFLDRWDLTNRQKHAVITKALSERWNWKLGNFIMLRDIPFKVVGIVEVGASSLDLELGGTKLLMGEHVVFIPKTITPYWASDLANPKSQVDAILLRAKSSIHFSSMLNRSKRLFSKADKLRDSISWATPKTLLAGIKKLRDTIKVTIGSIAIMCLILGGSTLMSLMLANVNDRVGEIGLRRSLGASQKDIAATFILEGLIITGAAGLFATIGAHILLLFSNTILPVPIRPGLMSVLIPVLTSMAIGALFSYLPARSAAQITPSDALRND